MATMYYDNDADLSLIQQRKVAIIGYGSQGHAHALNLKDSGVSVKVGLPAASRSRAKAQAAGLAVGEVADVARWADVVMILIPDHLQGKVYREEIEPNLQPGNMVMFAHGFNIRFGAIVRARRRRRLDGRAEVARPPRARAVRRRRGHAGAVRGPAGRDRAARAR